MDRMTFIDPVNVGELVTCTANVNAAWRTSMEVGVRVEAENPRTGEHRHTSTAYLTMVAVDENGKPTPVPPLLRRDRRPSSAASARPSCAGRTASPSASRSSPTAPPRRSRPQEDTRAAIRSDTRPPTKKIASHISVAARGLTNATGIESHEDADDEQGGRAGVPPLIAPRVVPNEPGAVGCRSPARKSCR